MPGSEMMRQRRAEPQCWSGASGTPWAETPSNMRKEAIFSKVRMSTAEAHADSPSMPVVHQHEPSGAEQYIDSDPRLHLVPELDVVAEAPGADPDRGDTQVTLDPAREDPGVVPMKKPLWKRVLISLFVRMRLISLSRHKVL